MTFIGCNCTRFDPRCPICRNARAAYRAGSRAYRQGKSSHTKHGHHGYSIHWTEGWYDARDANPNTAAARAKERKAQVQRILRQLKRERAALDRRIKNLSP